MRGQIPGEEGEIPATPVSSFTQQVPTLLWLHANGHNMLGPTCSVLLANNVASVCMGLYIRVLAFNLTSISFVIFIFDTFCRHFSVARAGN